MRRSGAHERIATGCRFDLDPALLASERDG
jgi:hypothetical protein